MLYTLNLYGDVYQLYFNKTEKINVMMLKKYSDSVHTVTHPVCSNTAQGHCWRTVGPSTAGPSWWGIGKLVIFVPSERRFLSALGLYGHWVWPNQAFPCHQANQAATIKGLEKVSTMYRYSCQIDSDCGSHYKGHDDRDWITFCSLTFRC